MVPNTVVVDRFKCRNAYVMCRYYQGKDNSHLHEKFFKELTGELLEYDNLTPEIGAPSIHQPAKLTTRSYCQRGHKQPGSCEQGSTRQGSKRCFGEEISGNARVPKRARQVTTGCQRCIAALCIDRASFARFRGWLE